jgi:hypothetical protein
LNANGVRKFQPRVYTLGTRVVVEINAEGVGQLFQSSSLWFRVNPGLGNPGLKLGNAVGVKNKGDGRGTEAKARKSWR